MIYSIRKTVLACGVAGILTVAAAAPALAQVVVVDPYYGGPYGAYAGPYGGYGYSRGYRPIAAITPQGTIPAACPFPTAISAGSRDRQAQRPPTRAIRASVRRIAADA